jgi:hypothetical protein
VSPFNGGHIKNWGEVLPQHPQLVKDKIGNLTFIPYSQMHLTPGTEGLSIQAAAGSDLPLLLSECKRIIFLTNQWPCMTQDHPFKCIIIICLFLLSSEK